MALYDKHAVVYSENLYDISTRELLVLLIGKLILHTSFILLQIVNNENTYSWYSNI